MRKIMERCMAALLAAALVCSLGFSVLAEGGSIQPTSTAVPVGSSDAADVSSSVPPTEPESTPLPESTPASSAAPSETPLPSETPGTGETPAPTETPQATATPMPTPTPAETPSPSAMPEPSGTPAPTATPAPAFEKLEVTDTTGAVQAEVGDEVEFSVELNRDDVEVAYQWQVLDTAPGQEEQPEAIYDYGEGESTDYFFPLEDMTEEELLAQNPGATWPGIEMYYALRDSQVSTFSTRSASAEPPRIENGTPNFVLNPEETDVEAGEIAWRDIDGETKASYVHTVTENEEHLSYRCIVTVTDEEYLAEAQQAAQSAAEGAEPQESEAGEEVPTEAESAENGPSSVPESAPESTVPEKEETSAPDESEQPVSESTAEGLAEESIITETMHIEVPAQPEEDQPEEETQGLMAGLFSLFRANGTAPDVKLSEDNQWLVGMDTTMEYITANTYEEQDASAANNPYWTKIAGGTRPDGTQYKDTFLTDGNKMEVLSAWYGKTVYVRIAGNSGKGTAIEIPAYTGIDYQTGERVLYKKSVKVFNAWVPNTGRSFYQAFLRTALNDGWAADNCHLTIDSAPADDFNKYPTWYLTNAEGDYVYDLVIWGSATMEIPDLSGAAAWALQDYLAKGYGFMIGHDMMYHYGGVAGEGYVPDPNDTTTPYYQLNTDMAGSWNMNWLMGQNEMYDVANPYDAASMILCCGNWHDKTPLYGDDSGSSTLRVVTRTEGDPFTSVAARCPTNYPYNASFQGPEFTVGLTIDASATHTNMQMAFGTIWVDYASNSIEQKGFGRLMTATRAGLQGTNNFYLTTNGSFGMNQIGHKTANFNVAKIDECRILANTVMYLSQRQQCQVCQSQQNGNQEVHFVHRISSAEELAKLNDQDKYWFTHPIGDCYILANDIVLPDDWTPIQGFTGHFDADSHTITLGANGAPVFDTGTKGWNLGSEKEKGTPAIVDAGGGRTTGVARVVGYLSGLGLEDAGGTQGYTVTVFGTDGNEYSCVANRDGKYVLSNLPCTGVMQAEVKDRSGNVVISREIGRVCVPGTLDDYAIPVRNGEEHAQTAEGFWASAETTQLYVLGLEALPVLNTTIYEEQDAIMLEGGARYHQLVTDIKWEYDGTTNATVTNLKFRAADDESGVVAGDKVAVAPGSFAGVHSVIDQTDGKQVEITRRVDVRLSLSNNELGDYYIASEEYTGAVLPRSLHVHSLYLDDGDDANNPRNIKQYDGTDAAVISDILIDGIIDGDEVWVDKDSYAGTYAQSDAGEDLTADGTAKPNRYRNLKEVDITRTEAIALVHNEKGNYRIASEDYSGAIYRRALSIMVGHMVTTYGDGLDETPTTAGTYSATEGGSGTHLTISALVANDVLKLDDSKGGFVYDAITEKTPAGTYPLDYEGINETNYPVLSNYIIWQEPGDITVLPRKITITVNPSEKVYGDANPPFSVSYEGFINDDTPEDMLEGELEYKTDCDERSPVRYYDDGSYAPYEVSASGLTCKENENYEYNYEIEWVPGPLVVKRRPVVITGPTIEINEGEPVPPFHYTPENPLVNGDEFVSGGLFTDPENPTAPGEYPILSDLDAGPNYDLTYIPGKLIINQHLGVIKMYLPQEEATVHTPDGMTYTVSGNPGKPFPKTDVNITEVENATENEDGSITVPFGFTSAEGEEPGYTPPEMVEYQGKTYVLAEKDVQINASEAPAGKEETVHYDGLTEKTVPDTYHIENGAQSYDLVLKDVSYAEAEPSTLTIDYVSSAEPAAPQTYTANVDGKPVTFILSGIEQTSDYAWRPLDMPVEYWGHPLAKYYLGEISKGRAMPYNKARPYYDGYEADILDYLGVSDKEYRIAASKWTDDGFQAIEHQLRRRGTITLEHYTATWTATYVSASLGYTAEAVYTDDINGTVSYTALATYKPAGGFPVLRAVVIASAGIALLILAIILILLALKKKREQEGLNKSDSKGEIPQNPFYK